MSEFRFQFAPRWLDEKSIATEKDNLTRTKAYVEVAHKDIQKNGNIICSHHFFNVKQDGEQDKLKLKCRLVPHGNKDVDKDEVRKDSATAQFSIIRLLLSLAVIFQFNIASLDVKSAYLQAGEFPRDIYMYDLLNNGYHPTTHSGKYFVPNTV